MTSQPKREAFFFSPHQYQTCLSNLHNQNIFGARLFTTQSMISYCLSCLNKILHLGYRLRLLFLSFHHYHAQTYIFISQGSCFIKICCKVILIKLNFGTTKKVSLHSTKVYLHVCGRNTDRTMYPNGIVNQSFCGNKSHRD